MLRGFITRSTFTARGLMRMRPPASRVARPAVAIGFGAMVLGANKPACNMTARRTPRRGGKVEGNLGSMSGK